MNKARTRSLWFNRSLALGDPLVRQYMDDVNRLAYWEIERMLGYEPRGVNTGKAAVSGRLGMERAGLPKCGWTPVGVRSNRARGHDGKHPPQE